MRRWMTAGVSAAAFLMAGCVADQVKGDPAATPTPASVARADLRSATGSTVARVTVEQLGESIRVRLNAMGMPAGGYGAHVHAVGRCDAPDFSSAGPHWNPTGHQHGRSNPQGMHLGDLPNLVIGADGSGTLEIVLAGAMLKGDNSALFDADGAALVIHERPDDYRTDPSGNSGARIACGVLREVGS